MFTQHIQTPASYLTVHASCTSTFSNMFTQKGLRLVGLCFVFLTRQASVKRMMSRDEFAACLFSPTFPCPRVFPAQPWEAGTASVEGQAEGDKFSLLLVIKWATSRMLADWTRQASQTGPGRHLHAELHAFNKTLLPCTHTHNFTFLLL